MKSYYRIMPGPKSVYLEDCRKEGYIGCNFDIDIDLTNKLTEDWKRFNEEFIPIWLSKYPGKSKISAGLACGQLWTICKGLNIGDIVLCPDGSGHYFTGEVTTGYMYHPDSFLPHRRGIKWNPNSIDRSLFSDALKNSTGSIGTVSNISKYRDELQKLFTNDEQSSFLGSDEADDDSSVFTFEKYLEEFLYQNWSQTELGKKYDIYQDGDLIGRQFHCDTGYMDLLAISKDKSELLVVELKRGRASDSVVGQIQRYMGYVKQELAEDNQTVKGVIIALDDDIRIRRALVVANNIEFYRYQVSFKLVK